MTMTEIEGWVRDQYRTRYCDENGKQRALYLFGKFITELKKGRPGHKKAIKLAVER